MRMGSLKLKACSFKHLTNSLSHGRIIFNGVVQRHKCLLPLHLISLQNTAD